MFKQDTGKPDDSKHDDSDDEQTNLTGEDISGKWAARFKKNKKDPST